MKTLRSFAAALLIFILIVSGLNIGCSKADLKSDSKKFGFWYSPYKSSSFDLLADNLKPETMLLMGSSEFRHGRKSIYYPGNLFQDTDMEILTIGGPYNQSLFHLIALGALEPKLKSRKVMLLISPSWFKKKGVRERDYQLRFSETQYIEFMQNTRIPEDIRKYASQRSETLMKSSQKQSERIKRLDEYLLGGKNDLLSSFWFQMEKRLAFSKDRITAAFSLILFDKKTKSKASTSQTSSSEFSWEKLSQRAITESRIFSNNPFYMSDLYWRKDIQPVYHKLKGFRENTSYEGSPEYQDLEVFLKMCKSLNLRCKVVVLPVNGRWFDYTGMTQEKRQALGETVKKLADQYGSECSVLSIYDYEKYITEDSVHPWNKGWVKIDEEIYRFYQE